VGFAHKMHIESCIFKHLVVRSYTPPKYASAYIAVWDFIYPPELVEQGECIVCKRRYSSRIGLAYHLKRSGCLRAISDNVISIVERITSELNAYRSTNKFKCAICGYKTSSRPDFVEHALKKHPQVVSSWISIGGGR